MCGRFENNSSLADFFNQLNLEFEIAQEEFPKENIAPTQKILALIFEDGKIKPKKMNWGIKFKDDSPLIFNSRIETIKEKSFWKNLFDKNRCIVPMTGFYEWTKENNKKVPYRIFLENEKYFFVPALFTKKDNEFFASLITTTPNNFIKKIHHRMPVIIDRNNIKNFFTNSIDENLELCQPLDNSIQMKMERVEL